MSIISCDDKQRIAGIIILAISFFFSIPFLGIISGIYLLRQSLPIGFKVGAVVIILEQLMLYLPLLLYVTVKR